MTTTTDQTLTAIIRIALILALIVAVFLVSSTYRDPEPATTIGGTKVPAGLVCQEDEYLGFHGVPDEIVCVHADDLRG